MWRLVVEHLVEIPDHRIGVEGAAVVKFDVAAQDEHPFLGICRIDLPFRRKAGNKLARAVCDVHLPRHQRIVDGVAGELVGAGAAIRLAGGERNIRQRNALPNDRFGVGGNRRKGKRKR